MHSHLLQRLRNYARIRFGVWIILNIVLAFIEGMAVFALFGGPHDLGKMVLNWSLVALLGVLLLVTTAATLYTVYYYKHYYKKALEDFMTTKR